VVRSVGREETLDASAFTSRTERTLPLRGELHHRQVVIGNPFAALFTVGAGGCPRVHTVRRRGLFDPQPGVVMNAPSKELAYSPIELASWLELWALRREKVLELLDITAARRARQLADRCRRFAIVSASQREQGWNREWHALKLEVAAFLTDHRSTDRIRRAR
jgi:hypothetical protein